MSGKDGDLKLVNQGGGTSGTFPPNLNVGKDEKVQGIFHTHPYDKSEGGATGVSLSGGDAAYMINGKQNVIIAQSGSDQFMYMRTDKTPSSVDFNGLNNGQNNRITELTSKGVEFNKASQIAARETAEKNGLAYYEGKGGVFKRKYP